MLPLLILMILMLLDAGRGVYYYSVIFNAAREGARWGVIDPVDTAGIEAAARAKAVGLDQTDMLVFIDMPTEWTVRVRVSYEFDLITPVINVFFGGNPLTLETVSIMHVEG
jgi:Flp pilus assembly protein TadG